MAFLSVRRLGQVNGFRTARALFAAHPGQQVAQPFGSVRLAGLPYPALPRQQQAGHEGRAAAAIQFQPITGQVIKLRPHDIGGCIVP